MSKVKGAVVFGGAVLLAMIGIAFVLNRVGFLAPVKNLVKLS